MLYIEVLLSQDVRLSGSEDDRMRRAASYSLPKLSPQMETRNALIGNISLSGSPLVTVMEASHLRDLHHRSKFRRLNRSRFRRIFIQRQMRARMQIVLKIRFQNPTERRFVEHHDVVEAFAAY